MLNSDECEGTKGRLDITPPSSPTSLSSFTSKPIGQNGYYDNPIASYRLSSSGGEGEFKFLDSKKFENTEVFTITNGTNTLSDRSQKSDTQSPTVARESSFSADKYKWTDSDGTDGSVTHRKTKSRKICLIVLVTLLVLGLLTGVAVILGFTVFKQKEEIPVSTTQPLVAIQLDGALSLQENWTPDLDNPSSPLYQETENNFTREMDFLMRQSNLSDIYLYTEVISLRPGSIKVRFKMAFSDDYKLKVDSDEKLADRVEQEIKESSLKTQLRVVRQTVRVMPLPTTLSTQSSTVPSRSSITSNILQPSWTISSETDSTYESPVISSTSFNFIISTYLHSSLITDYKLASTHSSRLSVVSLSLDKSSLVLTDSLLTSGTDIKSSHRLSALESSSDFQYKSYHSHPKISPFIATSVPVSLLYGEDSFAKSKTVPFATESFSLQESSEKLSQSSMTLPSKTLPFNTIVTSIQRTSFNSYDSMSTSGSENMNTEFVISPTTVFESPHFTLSPDKGFVSSSVEASSFMTLTQTEPQPSSSFGSNAILSTSPNKIPVLDTLKSELKEEKTLTTPLQIVSKLDPPGQQISSSIQVSALSKNPTVDETSPIKSETHARTSGLFTPSTLSTLTIEEQEPTSLNFRSNGISSTLAIPSTATLASLLTTDLISANTSEPTNVATLIWPSTRHPSSSELSSAYLDHQTISLDKSAWASITTSTMGSYEINLSSSMVDLNSVFKTKTIYDSNITISSSTIKSAEELSVKETFVGTTPDLSYLSSATSYTADLKRDSSVISTQTFSETKIFPAPSLRLPTKSSSVVNTDETIVKETVHLLRTTSVEQSTSSTILAQTSSTTSRLTTTSTTEAPDRPPRADAGADITINLPTNYVTLDGSRSSDDRGIVEYTWTQETELTATLAGVKSAELQLSNLQEGSYVFKLIVRDESSQTSSDTVTVVVLPEMCLTVPVDVCERLGFTKTQLPNMLGQDNLTKAMEVFDHDTKSIHNQICQNIALSYLCSLFFPKCDESTGSLILPCRSLCEEAVESCNEYFVNPIDCRAWQETDCVKPPAPPTTTTTVAPTCEAVLEDDCSSIGFNYTSFPNLLGEVSQDEVLQTYDAYFRYMIQNEPVCHPYVGYFICGSQFPMCIDGHVMAPCRRVCEVVLAACEELSFFDCNYYPEIDCVAPAEPVAARQRQPKRKCQVREFTCGQVTKCIPADKVCDGVNDCTDWTDEMDCQCDPQYQYQCKMGMCIKSYQECDGTSQCPDNSDESHCDGCRNGQVRCPNTDKCIMREWLCDGRNECDDGWDEWNCDRCSRSNFTCTVDQSCIPMTQRCDGVDDCSQGEDEWNCVKLEKDMLQLLHKKKFLPVCAESWNDAFGNYTCEVLLGQGHFINSTEILYNGLYFVKLRDDGNLPSLLGNMALSMDCLDNKAISINCKPRGCGKRMVDSSKSHITGGENAAHGKWPWHAALYMGNMYFCGGTLINEQFVITAAHCVEKYVGDFQTKMKVKLGANNRKEYHQTQRVISVQAISSHSMHVWFERNDIALLQLANPVNFTDYIQPVCLPDENEPLPLHSECWTIGWGKTRWDADYAEVLQELKMKLWDTQKCNSSIAWNGEVYDTFLCAGYHSGVRSICKGDSGGPLLCLDRQRVWRLVGINSYVANFCNMTQRPNIFTDVRYFLPWIYEKIECKFRCDNGKCLYSGEALCNRVDDCGDNSDETRNCNFTASCTFDDKFLCGYNWTGWGHGFDNKKAIMIELDGQFHTQSYAPQFDSTHGKLPGYFFYGKVKGFKEGLLWSPKFSISGQTCVRFAYYLRGEIRDGLDVYMREFYTNGSYTTRLYWRSQIYVTGTDEWRTGYFDITLGEFQIVFKTGELLKVAVDDVKTISGMCSQVLCDAQHEYRCVSEDGRRDKCIPRESRCNLVIDCPDGEDERSCIGQTRSFECTFENGNMCGLRQNFGDASDWWLTNGTFVRDESLQQTFEDHTLKSELGHMFYLNSYNLQSARPIYTSQFFYLYFQQYCLSFYYIRKAEVNFTVHVQSDGYETQQYSILPTFYGWTLIQLNLPQVEMVNVTYDIRGLNVSFYSYVVIDDITVTPDLCPTYNCPAGYYKCDTVDRCFPGRARCNRNLDCQDESDEANCECNANEFRCNNGRCIPESRMCDRTIQCLDGSDEQSCASYASVSCNFQHPYLCGYEFQSYSKYSWKRWSGSTPTPVTGPQYDHTLRNNQGFYIYAEANEGAVGDNTTVRSPSFNTGYGNSIEFWYHMFSSSYIDTRPGILHFILEDASTGFQTIIWSTNKTDLMDAWRGLCFNLPGGQTLVAVFTAIRDETTVYGVDFAIDDVRFNNYRCTETPQDTMPTTEPTTSTTTESVTGEPVWYCNNGQDIPESYHCDGTTDCIDGSDERGCF